MTNAANLAAVASTTYGYANATKLQSGGVTTNALAWVNFNGTSSSPITPRSSYNVSSITKSSTALYTVNFTTATTDANYAVLASFGNYGGTSATAIIGSANPINTSSCFVNTRNATNSDNAYDSVSLAVFGN